MSGIHRFLTRRDRHGRGRQSKEEKPHVLPVPHFRGFFTTTDTPSNAQENSSEHEKKIKNVEARIRSIGITTLDEQNFSYALQSTNGDVDKAISLLLLLEDSIEGIIRSYTPHTKLLGAVNRQGVTCYLDALLFAMFARLDCFEAILYKSFDDEPRRRLVILLRYWVNMLRSGRLITTDVTKHVQDALAECGWTEAALLRQQDASEAFTFITEKLELPLLTLKMDIYHTGKEDASDDHKFINERLLEVAIPPEPEDGHTLTLEDCLEAYFNNRIEVKRYLDRRNTLTSTRSADSLSTTKGFTAHVEELDTTPTRSPAHSISPRNGWSSPWMSLSEVNESLDPRTLGRRDSIVRERFIPDPSQRAVSGNDLPAPDAQQQSKGVYRKEVMMPAWQFFSLIPWYTDNTPTNDAQVAAHFSAKRPILGLCLKRYSFTPQGKAVRLDTYIDIPTEIGLPHFIQDDNMDANAPIYGSFKLSLQAMVCHRGNSVDSGHYIAIIRGTSPNHVPPSSSGSSDAQPVETPKHWMRFDDLAKERVTLIEIDEALKQESPYLLFYQILPIDQDASMANFLNKVPSSRASDATVDVDMTDISEISRKLMGLATEVITDGSTTEDVASARPSFEITGPNSGNNFSSNSARRPSVAFSETGKNGHKPRSVPSSSPQLAPMGEENNKTFTFARRGSRATKSNSGSRANSQSGENRIGASFSRFAARLSKDRFTSDGEGEVDESAVYADDGLSDSARLGLPDENKGKVGRGRSKDRGSKLRPKEKSKEKHKEKIRPERECVVM